MSNIIERIVISKLRTQSQIDTDTYEARELDNKQKLKQARETAKRWRGQL